MIRIPKYAPKPGDCKRVHLGDNDEKGSEKERDY